MKAKHLPFFLAFFLINFSSNAQSDKFNVGIDVYPNYSVYSGDTRNTPQHNSKLSISFGVAVTYKLTTKLSFESGLKYSNKGRKGGSDYGYYPIDIYPFQPISSYYISNNSTTNYNYLSVPLNIRFALADNSDKGWYVRFGFAADYFLSSQTKYKKENEDGTISKWKGTDEDDIRKTHLNLNYGIGYSFLVEEKYQLSVEPAFEYMFYKMFHKGSEDIYNSIGVKMRFMVL